MKENKNKNPQSKNTTTQKNKKKSRFLITFVCIFLSVVVVFGGVFGAMLIIRDARAAVKYDSVLVDEGTVKFLASRYKTQYLAALNSTGVDASDTPMFWSKVAEDSDKTYGELFKQGLKSYIAGIVVANAVYLGYASYTTEDKRRVANATSEILTYRAQGSVATFNELTERFGFNYNDFLNGSELLYKAEMSVDVVYGKGGTNLENFPQECAKYLAEYSHVSLLFLREDTKIVENEDGSYDEVDLTPAEREERENIAEALRTAIAAREQQLEDGWITPEMFEMYLKKSDGDSDMYSRGYYFHPSAETTAEFATEFEEIVTKSFEMEIGDYAEVECSIGTCFIYKYDVAESAYTDSSDPFFSDFYSNASDYLYAKILDELIPLVEFREIYDMVDTLAVPKNYEFYVKSWD